MTPESFVLSVGAPIANWIMFGALVLLGFSLLREITR